MRQRSSQPKSASIEVNRAVCRLWPQTRSKTWGIDEGIKRSTTEDAIGKREPSVKLARRSFAVKRLTRPPPGNCIPHSMPRLRSICRLLALRPRLGAPGLVLEPLRAFAPRLAYSSSNPFPQGFQLRQPEAAALTINTAASAKKRIGGKAESGERGRRTAWSRTCRRRLSAFRVPLSFGLPRFYVPIPYRRQGARRGVGKSFKFARQRPGQLIAAGDRGRIRGWGFSGMSGGPA